MEFRKSVTELIRIRKSCRTYDGRSIENTTLQELSSFVTTINQEAKIKGRFLLANNTDVDGKSARRLGTYGFISGARSFIVGILNGEEKGALEFGYLFEKIVLFATDLGLQTCWLGGSFNKSDFKQNVSVSRNEFIPIVSPVGHSSEKPRLLETAMRVVVGADNRKPWKDLFFDGNSKFPLTEESAGAHKVPLEMVRLGPSASNKQPWRVIKDNNAFHFFLCRTKGYGFTSYDLQKNDMGIAKCHFELSANSLGLKGVWQEMESVNALAGWEYISTWSPLSRER
jgi:nitroreductase